jgi:hypothetical protein
MHGDALVACARFISAGRAGSLSTSFAGSLSTSFAGSLSTSFAGSLSTSFAHFFYLNRTSHILYAAPPSAKRAITS